MLGCARDTTRERKNSVFRTTAVAIAPSWAIIHRAV